MSLTCQYLALQQLDHSYHFAEAHTILFRDTLTYWVQRMEPIIRAETQEEIIIVFCNRTGIEEDTVYAGTSAVIGIKQGEVSVYGLLGRCEKGLLIVDTDSPPLGKLIMRQEKETHREHLENSPANVPVSATSENKVPPAIGDDILDGDDDVEISS